MPGEVRVDFMREVVVFELNMKGRTGVYQSDMMGLMVGHDGEEGGRFLGEKILGAVVRIAKGLVIFGSYQNFIY